ncbi:MAG: DegV family protein [Clostridia bacterium]|nr:DegV family protein [Clostridia bacterium]
MANKIKICADSTCDLSPELVQKYDIEIIPMPVYLDDQLHYDMVDITPDDIYKRFYATKQLPKTAAINNAVFEEVWSKWLDQGYDIINFDISSEMSSVYSCARTQALEHEGRVFTPDSRNLSTGIGLSILKAAELAAQGMSAAEITEYIESYVKRVDVSFVLNYIDFLWKGGRCSGVAALGANVLKIKPVIEVIDGSMQSTKKLRGAFSKAMVDYIEYKLKDRTDLDYERIFVTHSGIDKELEDLAVATVKRLQPEFKEVLVTQAGCCISSHCGPDCIGVLFATKE